MLGKDQLACGKLKLGLKNCVITLRVGAAKRATSMNGFTSSEKVL